MTVNPSSQTELHNPWQEGTSLPTAKKPSVVLAALALLVCCLALPFAKYEAVSLGVLALLFAYVAVAVRMPSAVTLILVTAFVSVLVGTTFSTGAVVLALIVGTCCGTFLLTTLRQHRYLVLLVALVALVAAFAVTRSWQLSLLSLSFLPASVLLSLATVWDRGRTSAVCWALGGLLAVAALLLYGYLSWQSSLSGVSIAEYFNQMRTALAEDWIATREESLQMIQSTSAEDLTEQIERVRAQLSDSFFVDLAAQIFNLLPAIVVVLCAIVAYEAQMMLNACYRTAGLGCVVTPRARIFTMSLTAATLYFVSFLVTMFAKGSSLALSVVNNLCLMLMPGFLILGVQSLVVMFAQLKGGVKTVYLLLFVAMLCCGAGTALYMLAFLGTYHCIMGTLRQKMLQKMQQNGNSHDDGGDDSDGEDGFDGRE